MRTSHWMVAVGCAGLAIASSGSAIAQERLETEPQRTVRAPKNAFELGVEAGYSQGISAPAEGYSATDLSKAGGSFALQAGYRIVPEFAVHLYGQFDEFIPGDRLGSGAKARGGVVGANGTFHLLPFDKIDPWIRLGFGYRALWTMDAANNQPDTMWHGFQLARLDVGADFRTSQDVSIGPSIGVDLSYFTWRNPTGDAANEEISGKRVVPFVFGGIQGRFDFGGDRVTRPDPTLASR
jgi:hypothetical protein